MAVTARNVSPSGSRRRSTLHRIRGLEFASDDRLERQSTGQAVGSRGWRRCKIGRAGKPVGGCVRASPEGSVATRAQVGSRRRHAHGRRRPGVWGRRRGEVGPLRGSHLRIAGPSATSWSSDVSSTVAPANRRLLSAPHPTADASQAQEVGVPLPLDPHLPDQHLRKGAGLRRHGAVRHDRHAHTEPQPRSHPSTDRQPGRDAQGRTR